MSAIRRVIHCMGTVFSVDIREPGVSPEVVDEVEEFLHWADRTFSTYIDTSEICRLDSGRLQLQDCSTEVRDILARVEKYAQQTGGYFTARPVRALDTNGIVKGWAVECASDLLREAGSRHHCINGAGDVQCIGGTEPGSPWRVGIVDPRDSQRIVAVVGGFDIAVATSGTAERGEHIIDPHTGLAPRGLLSVTVVGSHLTEADVFATAAFARGAGASGWLTQQPGYAGLVVSSAGVISTIGQSGLDGRIRNTDGTWIELQ